MPLYEYECAKCGTFEVNQRITEPALTSCPECKGKKVNRLISTSSFSLKGDGWYRDLYGKSGSGSSGGGGKTA